MNKKGIDMNVGIYYLDNYNMGWEPLKYAHENDAGIDLRAAIKEEIHVPSRTACVHENIDPVCKIPCGIKLEIPAGYHGQIRSRSGLAAKNGIMVLNSPGTIDSDYRGEVVVILVNLSNEYYTIKPGDRIAQIVFTKHENVQLTEKDLTETIRGEKGFGSTGV